jgi:sugar/nucleoside kinase (ribokinase family)
LDVKNFLGAFGHVNMDYIITLRHLPRPNTSIEILDRRQYFGGTAGNVARAAARLGVKTSLASFVGQDFPAEYRSALQREGVDLTDLRTVRGTSTPTVWIFSDAKGGQMAIVDQGPMKKAASLPILRHSVRDVELVHLGTGRPEYYRRVADLAEELGRPIAFDPSQEIHYVYTSRLFRTLLGRSTYFFGNEAEISQAKRFARVSSTEALLKFTSVVIVTMGSKGSVAYTRDGRVRIPRVRPARVVDVTGAGDAYRAGFYAGLSRGYDVRRCGILGSTVASFVVESKGTQTRLPTWMQVIRRARRYFSS